jgi:predicted DNA-binding WGR domain protein
MDHRSFSNLVLHRIDTACNMARFYAMSIEPTPFGGEALVRNWGRIGTRGRYRMDLFEDEAAAERAMARLARIKCGRGYVPVHVGHELIKWFAPADLIALTPTACERLLWQCSTIAMNSSANSFPNNILFCEGRRVVTYLKW